MPEPPALGGLLLQSQLAPIPRGNPGGLQARGSNVYIPLACLFIWVLEEHCFPSWEHFPS